MRGCVALTVDELGAERWDAFCADSSGAWFFHTSRWLAYQRARGGEDWSFALLDGDRIVAACPVMLEHGAGGSSFSMDGHPCPWPAFRNHLGLASSRRVAEEVAHTIALKALELRVSYAFRTGPFTGGGVPLPQMQITNGWSTRVTDLTAPAEELHAGLRKSYTSIVNAGMRRWEFLDGIGGPEARSAVEIAERLHAKAAGRKTRPTKTWEMMADWAVAGDAVCLVARRQDQGAVGFAYFLIHKRHAYYASAAALEPNVGHALLWAGILKLKGAGVRRLEIGWQGQAEDKKGRNVEHFKAGFPGTDVPILVAERRL